MSDHDSPQTFFRCPVQAEMSQATLIVGRRKVPATLQETSIEGFTVTVCPRQSQRLRIGRAWVLRSLNDCCEVHAEWFYNAPDGGIQIGLRRVRDLLRPERPSGWLSFGQAGRKSSSGKGSEVAFAGAIVFLFVVLCLPGVGDKLGTAPRLQAALQLVLHSVDSLVRSCW